jgi:hypothetical protein
MAAPITAKIPIKGSYVWREERGGMFACAFSILQLPKAGGQAVRGAA